MNSILSYESSVALFILVVAVVSVMTYYRRARSSIPVGSQELDAERERRRKVEADLDLARTYFQNIVGISEDAIVSVNSEQRITLFNQGAEKTFGYRSNEVIGEPIDLLIPPRFHDPHRHHIRAFAASQDILRPMSKRGTVFGRRKDGSEFPAEASISRFQVRGEQLFTVRLRDVTEQRKGEEGLQRLAAIVESSDDAIIGKTLDGHIVSWNTGAERLYGYTAAEAVGQSVSFLMSPDRQNELDQILEQVRRGDAVTHLETVRVRKDGARLDVSLSVSPIKDATGRIVGAAAIDRDITVRKRLEAQIRQAQKMEAIGTLAGGIAHDFNNILGAIIGHTELAADRLPTQSPARQQLQEVLAAGKRASNLVRQILAFSRRTPDREPQPVDLQDLIREVMQLLRASLPATIAFRQQIEPGRTMVSADATRLHQVMVNLCTNAEHAMRGRRGLLEVQLKTVEVDAEFAVAHPPLQPGTYAKISIRDTGHGMTQDVQERIFDPFFTTKRAGEGTGMGLAVVHGIITAHGGAITVASAPGRGTRFDVYLPRCASGAMHEGLLEAPVRGQQEHILFVDDEPSLVRIWTATLQQVGYRVTGCADGREALEIFQAKPDAFDLVVTDHTMPQMTGEVLARELRRLRPDLPIILCTGFSHTMTEDAAKSLGIQAFLMKPVGRSDLCLTVQRLLSERAARSL
jgi:PAS domain S-box-containing protein